MTTVPTTPVSPSRRDVLRVMTALAAGSSLAPAVPPPTLRLASFTADVTIPLGHPCMGGGIAPAREVLDPLEALGIVLLPGDGTPPFVIVSVDWCEIRNDAYDAWRAALADAAGTEPARVLVTSVHQHDAPVADLTAERLLREHRAAGSICDPDFHSEAVRKVARALHEGLATTRPITHFGTGSAIVEGVASNRRYIGRDGKPAFDRGSATRDAFAREQPEGTIDPLVKTLSFWDADHPVAALSVFATHPMSYYGRGQVSADFVGHARRRRQADDPSVFQVYLSGCSGNVTAGKFNDGAMENRPVLAERLYQGMTQAWTATQRRPIERLVFRSIPLHLPPRDDEGFSPAELVERIKADPKPFGQCLAALGLSWRQRCEAGRLLDLPCLDLGPAALVLLPGESYVEFQLHAARLRPDALVLAAGYGECAPGYVPTEKACAERDTNLRDWCWVAPGAERALSDALVKALPGQS